MCYNEQIQSRIMKTGALLNGLTLCALALAVSAWSLVFLQDSKAVTETGIDVHGNLPLNTSFEAADLTSFTLNGKDGLTILPGSSLEVQWDEVSEDVRVELETGSVFAYTLSDELSITVVTSTSEVLSEGNLVLVKTEPESEDLTVYAVEHPALVTFTAEGDSLNALNVPGGYRMKISAAKVTKTLEKLRLAKLSKEFPIYALSDEDLSEEMSESLANIRKNYEASTVAFLNELQENMDFGPALRGLSSEVSQGYRSFEEALTVVPTAQDRLSESRKSDALTYAMSHYLSGDAVTADHWLTEWKTFEQDPEELQELYTSLFFVLPGEDLYPVKEAVAAFLFPQEKPLNALRRKYAEIENLLERASQVDAQKAYIDYQTQFEAQLESGAFDDEEDLDDISREYLLLELLLRSNSIFYSTDATHLLTILEQKIFALAGNEGDLDEERQAFVKSKVNFLANLFDYVLAKKITVSEASELATELIYQAEGYMNAITSEVAVKDYFESKLKEYTLSVQFMTSPEFYSYDSFAEGLADYKKKVADLEDLNEYLQNILEGQDEAPALSLEQATQIAKDDLYSNGIQYKDVNSLGDSANRLFEIDGGRTAGYSFTGKYDREGKILYDVVVGEVRFSTGLSLENAKEVIESAMQEQGLDASDVEEPEEEPEEVEDDTLTESVALELVAGQFKDAGLEPSAFHLTIVDLKNNEFSFEGIASAFNIEVSGSYDADTQRVTEIVWEYDSDPRTLPDLDLEDFEGALEASYTAITEQN